MQEYDQLKKELEENFEENKKIMIKNIFLILPRKAKKRFIKTLIMSFFLPALELLSLGLIIPIIYFVINPENELLIKIISFFKLNLNDTSTENIYNYLIISLIFIFIIKTIYLSYFHKISTGFQKKY